MDAPKIPNYQLEELIGLGRHGGVWRAKDADGQEVAIKAYADGVDLELLKTRGKRVGMEATQHGAALQVHHDFDSKPPYSIVELLGGEDKPSWSLEERAGELREDLDQVWEFLDSFAEAIAWLHRHPLPHGNLKPSNIFFTPTGAVRLTDHLLSGIGPKGICSDGLFYMPPEQLRHPGAMKEGSGYSWDVYAFGVEAFRLLTGTFPRLEQTFGEALKKGADHQLEIEADPSALAARLEKSPHPVWPEEIAESADPRLELILECLELHPGQRPANANELLARFRGSIPSPVVDHARFSQQHRARRRWKRATLGLVGVSFALAGLATWAWREESDRFSQLLNQRTSATEQLASELRQQRGATEEQVAANRVNKALARSEIERSLSREQSFKDRFSALSELNYQLFQFANHHQAGSAEFLNAATRRAALKDRINELKAQLDDSQRDRQIARRLDWYLSEIDFQSQSWEAAVKGLQAALAPPELWPENPATRTIPARELAEALLKLNRPAEASASLQESFKALDRADQSSEWHADQLGRNHLLAARIAEAQNQPERQIQHLKAALDAFDNAPAGHGSLVYFRRRYLEVADVYGLQLESRGDLDALNQLRQKALSALQATLKDNPGSPDGHLAFRLGQTRLALAKNALRGGQIAEVRAQQAALKVTIQSLEKLPNFGPYAAFLQAESQLLQAEQQWDDGQQSQALGSLQRAESISRSIKSKELSTDQRFLVLRLKWSKVLFAKGLPSAEEIRRISQGLESLSESAPEVQQRQIKAYHAALLSDASALLSRKDKPAALEFARESLSIWSPLLEQFPKQSDYQAMAEWTRETIERLSD